MIKKIVLTTIFILFAGILIYGAVNRTTATSAKAGEIAAQQGNAHGQEPLNQGALSGRGNQGEDSQGFGQGQGQSLGQGQGQGRGNQDGQGQGNQGQGNQSGQGQGQGNQGQGNQSGQGQGQGQGQGRGRNQQETPADILDIVTITGEVSQAPAAGVDMIMQTAEGEVLIGTGPGYLTEQGFVIEAGDAVSAAGFWENEEFKAVEITLLSSGESIILRDEWGRPMWSGAGRNAQNRKTGQDGV